MSIMAPGTPGSTAHPADNPVAAALVTLNSAPNLLNAMQGYLADPATTPAVRRLIAHTLDLGERLATAQAVAA